MDKKHPDIKKILIPFDFSDCSKLSLSHATRMARFNKAEVTLLHILEPVSFTSAISKAFFKPEEKIMDVAEQDLQTIADEIYQSTGIKPVIQTETGRIYKKIVEVARNGDFDIIVMGTHGVSGFQEFIAGSNAYRVVTDAPCPVITVQSSSKDAGFKTLILPIDSSPPSRQKVPITAYLAEVYGAKVVIAGLMTNSSEEFKRMFRVKIKQVEDYLTQMNVRHETIFKDGDNLADMSMATAKENDGDLIVIMTEQEATLAGALLGNYAQQIVNHSKFPILSVRPAKIDPDKIVVGM